MFNSSMEVKVAKAALLDTLKTNRREHREVFEKAMAGYRKQAIEELDRMIEEAKAGRKIRRTLNLVEPIDQTSDYDRVITMLEMSVDDVIVLDEQQFRQYVLDDWSWKLQFTTVNSSYLAQ